MQLAAAPLARDAIPAVESSAWAPFLAAWVHEAFVHARDAQRVPKRTRHAGTPDAVACGVTPSAHTGRLRGAHWHTRASRHRVPYDTFVRGLFDNHTPNEREYIESLASVMCVDALQPPHVAVWDNAYRLPWPTSSRDFVELVFCIPLPPHAEPFSEAHEQRAMELAPSLGLSRLIVDLVQTGSTLAANGRTADHPIDAQFLELDGVAVAGDDEVVAQGDAVAVLLGGPPVHPVAPGAVHAHVHRDLAVVGRQVVLGEEVDFERRLRDR